MSGGAPSQSSPPSGCNFDGADVPCGRDQIGYHCEGVSTPQGELGVPGCDPLRNDGTGSTIYCCTPTCALRSPRCGAPSTTYACGGSATPVNVACVAVVGYSGMSQYCCAEPDTCFAGPDTIPLLQGCLGEAMFCTGSATPSLPSMTCTAVASDGGACVRGYCCTPVDGGIASDGG